MNDETEQSTDHPDSDEVTNRTNSTRTVRLLVDDIEWLQEEARGSETPAEVVRRMREAIAMCRRWKAIRDSIPGEPTKTTKHVEVQVTLKTVVEEI